MSVELAGRVVTSRGDGPRGRGMGWVHVWVLHGSHPHRWTAAPCRPTRPSPARPKSGKHQRQARERHAGKPAMHPRPQSPGPPIPPRAASSADVASSRMITGESLSSARAMAMRWRCPPGGRGGAGRGWARGARLGWALAAGVTGAKHSMHAPAAPSLAPSFPAQARISICARAPHAPHAARLRAGPGAGREGRRPHSPPSPKPPKGHPPDSSVPRSPTTVLYPSGSRVMNSCALAASAAARISSAPHLPKRP